MQVESVKREIETPMQFIINLAYTVMYSEADYPSKNEHAATFIDGLIKRARDIRDEQGRRECEPTEGELQRREIDSLQEIINIKREMFKLNKRSKLQLPAGYMNAEPFVNVNEPEPESQGIQEYAVTVYAVDGCAYSVKIFKDNDLAEKNFTRICKNINAELDDVDLEDILDDGFYEKGNQSVAINSGLIVENLS